MALQQRIAKLGPGFINCNEFQTSCTRKMAQPRKGCPTCKFTLAYKDFTEKLERELKKIGTRAETKRWNTKKMIEAVSETAYQANTYKEGLNPKWYLTTSILVSIYRDELAKAKSIENYSLSQERAGYSED